MHRRLLLFLLFFSLFAKAQENSFKIYSVAARQEISFEQLSQELTKSQVIFLGEEHNDSVAHILERDILSALFLSKGSQLSLSLEMFQSDVQLVLNEYVQGLITETNLQKDARPWKNYADYRPMVEFAKEHDLYVLAANAPSRYTNRVTRAGLESLTVLDDDAKRLLAPLPIDTLTGAYYNKFMGLLGGHEGMGNLKIYQSQNLWDATMAWRIFNLHQQKPDHQIIHVNGRFHSDERLGTFAQLQHYAPELVITNISIFNHDTFNNPEWNNWSSLADYIIITDPTINRTF